MSDTIQVKVPDIGDFKDVEIIEVLVRAGDQVNAEDPLITLESDKATMEVPSPAAGTIIEMTVKAGDRISEGDVIAQLASDVDADDGESQESGAATSDGPDEEAGDDATAPRTETGDTHQSTAEHLPQDEDIPPPDTARRPPPRGLPPPVERAGQALPHASPGIRRFARELGADLNLIRGSGPKGRILKDDVKSYVKQQLAQPASTPPQSATGIGIPAMPEIDFSRFGMIDIQDVPRIKKLSGAHLHRAWLNIPHVTHHDEADITELETFRQQINHEQERSRADIKLTMLAFAMKAVAGALQAFPLFNSSLSADGQKLIFKKYFHVGIAVDTPNGLVVPVFRDVDKKGILQLAQEMAEVSGRAREGKLKPDEMQGGSMSISSIGGIGGTAFTPIVNAPEVAILGLTRSRMAPIWNGNEFTARLMLPLDLSYDHRVIDGAAAARFVTWLCQAMGDPRRLLL